MDKLPLAADGVRWWRFECDAGPARALACIGEHQERPAMIVLSISTDIRRLPLIWRLAGDVRLARQLRRTLEHVGAELIVEDD